MTRPVTLATLKTAAMERAGLENSVAFDTAAGGELEDLIQQSATALYDLILSAYGEDYYVTETTLSTVAGTATVTLPSDFYRLVGLWWPTTNGRKLETIAWDYVDFDSSAWTLYAWPRYLIQGMDYVRFSPVPTTVESVRCVYVPRMPAIDDVGPPAVPFQGVNGWEEWITWDVAIKLRHKDEADVATHVLERDAVARRIVAMAPRRDKGSPHRMVHRKRRRWLSRYL